MFIFQVYISRKKRTCGHWVSQIWPPTYITLSTVLKVTAYPYKHTHTRYYSTLNNQPQCHSYIGPADHLASTDGAQHHHSRIQKHNIYIVGSPNTLLSSPALLCFRLLCVSVCVSITHPKKGRNGYTTTSKGALPLPRAIHVIPKKYVYINVGWWLAAVQNVEFFLDDRKAKGRKRNGGQKKTGISRKKCLRPPRPHNLLPK